MASSQAFNKILTVVSVVLVMTLFLATWQLRQHLNTDNDLQSILSAVDGITGIWFVLLLALSGCLATLWARRAKPASSQADEQVRELIARVQDFELRQRLLLDEAVDVICVLDIESRFRWVSKSSKAAWGFEPSELVDKELLSILQVKEMSGILSAIVGAPKSIDRIGFEADLVTKSGAIISVSLTGHWSATESGLFCIVHDITRQKRAEEAALESERRMRELLAAQQELDRIKQEFVAMVTHDLRSPLTAVEGLLTLLEHGAVGTINPEGMRIAAGVRKECQRMLRLLNDMLQLERIESDEFELELAATDLGATISRALENAKSAAAAKEIALQTNNQTATCLVDEDRVMQVLTNLLSNAIKYAPEGSTIRVDLAEQKDEVLISVQDEGVGIPEDKVDKIFDKFTTVNARDIKKRGGTGLGLAICKSIVTQHGGKIGVSSALNEGSRFWFTLPKKQDEST